MGSTGKRSGARKRTLFRTVSILLAAAGLLLLSETAARLLTSYDSRWNVRLGAHRQFDELTQFRNRPYYTFPGGAQTNERGYLAPRNLSRSKRHARPPGRARNRSTAWT